MRQHNASFKNSAVSFKRMLGGGYRIPETRYSKQLMRCNSRRELGGKLKASTRIVSPWVRACAYFVRQSSISARRSSGLSGRPMNHPQAAATIAIASSGQTNRRAVIFLPVASGPESVIVESSAAA